MPRKSALERRTLNHILDEKESNYASSSAPLTGDRNA